MRTLCDVCESAAATLFCAADEAALCRACDQEVHMCNKLARRHVRVGLAEPCDVLLCDVCETAPAFFYCGIDGSSLCLQCDMVVHVGGKRSHGRFLLLRQRIEFPEDKPVDVNEFGQKPSNTNDFRRHKVQPANLTLRENKQYENGLLASMVENNDAGRNKDCNLIDLNAGPQRINCQKPDNQELRTEVLHGYNQEPDSVVPEK